jgi:hypothetical protein
MEGRIFDGKGGGQSHRKDLLARWFSQRVTTDNQRRF